MKHNLVKLSRLFLSLMFVFSAITKLLSLAFFDKLVAELLLGDDYSKQYTGMLFIQLFTRLMIAGELLLGAAVLQEKLLKKLVIPTIQMMLILFTIHLTYEGITKGFIDGNCGCFGDLIPMNNLESILKNVAAMLAGLYVYLNYNDQKEMRFQSWVMPVMLGILTFATLLLTVRSYKPKVIERPVYIKKTVQEVPELKFESSSDSTYTDSSNTEKSVEVNKTENEAKTEVVETKVEKEEKVESKEPTPTDKTKSLIYEQAKFHDAKKINLESGEQLVCMFSLTCEHCQEVYRDMCSMSEALPSRFLFLYGEELDLTYFFNQAGGCKDSYNRMSDDIAFDRMLEGESFPRVLHFKNGKIINSWNIDSYSKENLMKHFGIEIQEEKKDDGLNLEEEGGGNAWEF